VPPINRALCLTALCFHRYLLHPLERIVGGAPTCMSTFSLFGCSSKSDGQGRAISSNSSVLKGPGQLHDNYELCTVVSGMMASMHKMWLLITTLGF
jgi:hypothetical protein